MPTYSVLYLPSLLCLPIVSLFLLSYSYTIDIQPTPTLPLAYSNIRFHCLFNTLQAVPANKANLLISQ